MTDEHNGHEGHEHFVPVSFADVQRLRDNARMGAQVAIHAVNRMIASLNEEQLSNMQTLLRSLAIPEDGPGLAMHLDGMVKMHLHYRHGWCMCGEKHMEAEDILLQDIASAPDEDIVQQDIASAPDRVGETYSDPPPPWKEAARVTTETFETLMDEYNLILPVNGSTPVEVQCKLCGTRYPNLRDRMLMAPDECSGCRQKARHG